MKKYPRVYPLPAPGNFELMLSRQIDALTKKINEIIKRINMNTNYLYPDLEKIDIDNIWEKKIR